MYRIAFRRSASSSITVLIHRLFRTFLTGPHALPKGAGPCDSHPSSSRSFAEAHALDRANPPASGYLAGVKISLLGRPAVLAGIEGRIARKQAGGVISVTNTESMYHARRTPAHMAFINSAQYSLCDGVGVIVAGLFQGLRIPRYNGPVLQLDCSERGQVRGWRHFYYGGKAGVADEMAAALKHQFPDLQVVGTYSPPFQNLTAEEDARVVRMINECKPDFVWVGLGLLKQEAWIAAHRGVLEAPWLVGVGAAFDYHSGAVRWAPAPIRALGLEWLFRLILQPRLRLKRYWWSLVFVVQTVLDGVVRFKFLAGWRRPGGR